MYFTLLGDVKSANKKVLDIDKEISATGKEIVNKLNKKYGKELFHFVYRKRFWNEKENTFLGYERKRGALLQFNELLLGKMDTSEIRENFFVNTIKKNSLNIKYVITFFIYIIFIHIFKFLF